MIFFLIIILSCKKLLFYKGSACILSKVDFIYPFPIGSHSIMYILPCNKLFPSPENPTLTSAKPHCCSITSRWLSSLASHSLPPIHQSYPCTRIFKKFQKIPNNWRDWTYLWNNPLRCKPQVKLPSPAFSKREGSGVLIKQFYLKSAGWVHLQSTRGWCT